MLIATKHVSHNMYLQNYITVALAHRGCGVLYLSCTAGTEQTKQSISLQLDGALLKCASYCKTTAEDAMWRYRLKSADNQLKLMASLSTTFLCYYAFSHMKTFKSKHSSIVIKII